ncbi:MAG: integrating conjugative element protein (TIGR03761 family) [Porticoccaceae bacterium]|jgi:integrating conjugative element protein (TIGR03761 family)
MFQSKVIIALHSSDALILFKGGKNGKQFIPGFAFAQKRLNELFAMGMKENPFAEAALIEIDIRLDEVGAFMQEAITSSKKSLADAADDGMTVSLLTDLEPTQIEVNHASEYSNQLVKMMLKADKAFRYLRTAHSAGYMDTELATEYIRGIRRKTRMVFDRISIYSKKIDPKITREDISNKTAPAKIMVKKMGMPNKKILNGEVSFRHKRISELGV